MRILTKFKLFKFEKGTGMHPDQQPKDGAMVNEHGAEHEESTRRTRIIAGVLVGLVAFVAVGAGGYLLGRSQENSPAAAGSDTVSFSSASSAAAPTTKVPSRTPVTAADFRIDTTVLTKKCFGSAGCNVTYTIDPTFLGDTRDLEGRSFKVIYEVTGGEDPEIGNFSLTGTNMRYTESSSISTPSSDAVLTAQVTSVVESS